MKDLTSRVSSLANGSVELELGPAKARKAKDGQYAGKIPKEEHAQHKSFMSHCEANPDEYVNTVGLDESRTYMACAIAYDQKYKTAYAPCIPGAGCFY